MSWPSSPKGWSNAAIRCTCSQPDATATFDLIHEHSLAGPLLARGREVPTIVTMHWPAVGDLAHYFRELGDTIGLVAISESQRRLAPDLPWIGTVYT